MMGGLLNIRGMRKILLLFVLILLGSCSKPQTAQTPAAPPDLKVANSEHPGETLEMSTVLVSGKSTVCEFYSEQCPPCQQMAPILESIAAHHPDVAFRKLNIDRPGSAGIDFDSPLATSQNVHSVPYFRIYDAEGKLTAEGTPAKDQIREWYSQDSAFDQAQRSKEGRDLMKDYEKH